MALTNSQRSLLCMIVALVIFLLGLQVMGLGFFWAVQRMLSSNYERLKGYTIPCTIHSCVFLDVSIGFTPPQRLVLQLRDQKAPNTVNTFKALSTGEKGVTPSGIHLHYKNSTFSRIVPGILIQGGDIYGGKDVDEDIEAIGVASLEAESDKDIFDQAGLLALVGSGPSKNGYEFFITVDIANELNGMHVVFGEVIQGMDVVYKINNITLDETKPQDQVVIADCGQV